ncbi:phage recombination protein Bet [Helicobacter apodemus]|uniref:Phage recombination protein Bet n=1 Tax=Helicobacter apodemus TaxID=135569 RepID=A0A2U8FD56_9HELI|nr:phage recombination protein Bet [Helicobacter apodemus]AWI34181.1 phage recombination protein Bet [Helicobacter apodemus]
MKNITTKNNPQNLAEQDIEFIKNQMFPLGASVKDIDFCLKVAQELGLNPITKEIFFLERKSQVNGQWVVKVEPLVSRDGLLSMAHKSGNFGGIEVSSEIKKTPKMVNGVWEYKEDLVAKAIVYRNDTQKPFITEVAYSEYVQKTKEGNPTKFWADKPDTMIKKVAEAQALRKAFNINGIRSIDEVDGIITPQSQNNNDESLEVSAEVVDINQDLQALKTLGFDYERKGDWIRVIGDTYNKDSILENLGFFERKDSSGNLCWVKQVA